MSGLFPFLLLNTDNTTDVLSSEHTYITTLFI